MMIKAATISTRFTQVRLAVQRSPYLAGDHASVRPRRELIIMAAIGRLKTPIIPARSWRGWLISKTEAMASPTPAAISKPRAILPPIPFTCVHTVTAKAKELSAYDANISDNIQPYPPFAYSLTTRHEGSDSGLSTCKLASNSRTAPAAAIATRAAGTEIVVVSVTNTNGTKLAVMPSCASVCAH
jgi:hypothetical protein